MSKKLYGEAFLGWKGLLADEEGDLWSPSRQTKWPVGRWLRAKCDRPGHIPPVKSCGCGVYAVKTYDDLKAHHYHFQGPVGGIMSALGSTDETGKVWVLAEVALKGEVVPGAIGYRAQKACIQTIWVPMHKLTLGHKIADRYGADLGVIDRWSGKRKLLRKRRV